MSRSMHQSRLLYSVIIFASLASMRCTSTKQSEPVKDPVQATDPATAVTGTDQDLPPELRNADNYDPAASIDAESIKSSDFYQVKKSVESNRASLDSEWKAQDEQEEAVRKAKEAEKAQKEAVEQEEQKAAEEARLQAIKEYKSSAKKRAKYIHEANEKVKKMPTISREEVLWNGLED